MRKYLFLLLSFLSLSLLSEAQKSDFTLWQLPSQINTIGNSYVLKMNNGKIVVIDGGVKEEAEYLRGFLAALGNEVEMWFVSHPHPDHVGALTEILKTPGDLKIHVVYHSAFSSALCELEPDYKKDAEEFYRCLKSSEVRKVDVQSPGLMLTIGKTKFKILGIKHEEIKENPYNNSSMIIKVWDAKKSVLFLGDAGKECGDCLLKGLYRKELDCDYLQMAHHGQSGVRKEFYRTIKFKACLWPSPTWVYNNDAGKGFNTHTFETVEIRNLIDSLGIKKHFVSNQGLCKIE